MTSHSSSTVAAMMSNINDMPVWILIILEFSSWRERSSLMVLSKRWWNSTHRDYKFYRFLCTRLSAEHHVYIPSIIPTKDTWRSVFVEMYHLRSLWYQSEVASNARDSIGNLDTAVVQKYRAPVKERFKISVYARFRPSDGVSLSQGDKDVGTQKKSLEINLPLHQRLSMIRLARNLTSTKEALKVLASEGDWFERKWGSIIMHKESIIASSHEKTGVEMNDNSGDDAANGDCKENIHSGNYIPNRSNKNGSSFDADQLVPSFVDKLYRQQQQASSKQLQSGSKSSHSKGVDEAMYIYLLCSVTLL